MGPDRALAAADRRITIKLVMFGAGCLLLWFAVFAWEVLSPGQGELGVVPSMAALSRFPGACHACLLYLELGLMAAPLVAIWLFIGDELKARERKAQRLAKGRSSILSLLVVPAVLAMLYVIYVFPVFDGQTKPVTRGAYAYQFAVTQPLGSLLVGTPVILGAAVFIWMIGFAAVRLVFFFTGWEIEEPPASRR